MKIDVFVTEFQFALMRVSSSRKTKTRSQKHAGWFQFALMRVSSSRSPRESKAFHPVIVSIRADASELLEVELYIEVVDATNGFQFALMRVSSSRSHPRT